MRNGTESWWSHIIKSIPKTNTLFLQKNVPFCIYIVVGMYLYYDNGFSSRKGSGAEIAGNIIYWMMSYPQVIH